MDYEMADLLKIWRQRLVLILGLAFTAAVLTGLISFCLLPARYEATATLLIQPQNSGNQIDYENLMANEKLVLTYGEIIKSRKIAQDVIGRLKLKTPEKDLLKKVKTLAVNKSLVTAITVRDLSPKAAVDIANSFAISFKEKLPELMKVENISVLDLASVENSSEPVSPRPYLNMGIVFVAALNIGAALAFAMDVLDKTVRTEEQAEDLLGLPVLALIPEYPRKKALSDCQEDQGNEQTAEEGNAVLPG